MTEQNIEPLDIPAHLVVDNLRQEVARLNDERITLFTQLQFANQVIAGLKAQLEDQASDTEADGLA